MVKDNNLRLLEKELKRARKRFEVAKAGGFIAGDFDADSWRYKSNSLIFKTVSKFTTETVCLSRVSTVLAKAFILSEIEGRQGCSGALIRGRLIAFRHLAGMVERNSWDWRSLGKSHLNRTLDELAKHQSEASVYNRAGGLAAVAMYLNKINCTGEERFLHRYFNWVHGLKNPIRAMEDPTSETREKQALSKYRVDLAQSIASVRAALVAQPSLEPTPGYDLVRLESLAFALAMGVRIGEVTALPVHALDEESVPGNLFLRVPVEKSQRSNAMPVPSVWDGPVRHAYMYLLEFCAEARACAKSIEDSGFEFVSDALKAHRSKFPLREGYLAQMRVANLDPDNHYCIGEVSDTFELTDKQFSSDGRYHDAVVEVPKPLASRIVEWMDLRFTAWDWLTFTREKARAKAHTFVINDLADAIGANPGNINKQYSIIEDLKNLFRSMSDGGCFDPMHFNKEKDVIAWRAKWESLRKKIVSNSGGAHGTVVDIVAFKGMLNAQFSGYLGLHFDELVSVDGEDDESHVRRPADQNYMRMANGELRPGMERRLSDHLVVIWDGQFASDRPRGIVPRPLLRSDIYNYICANGLKKTVFERLNFRDATGKVVSFSPHMIRHWVNTAMLRSGPNELAVDTWMNRDPRQGRHYDHRTPKERAEYVRKLYIQPNPPDDYLGRRVVDWRNKKISEAEIAKLIEEKLRIVHFTPWGSCSRDLYTSPCMKGLMCIRGFGTGSECSYFQVDVNDVQAMSRIEDLHRDYKMMMRSLDPQRQFVAEALTAELNTTMPLDQHLMYIVDVIRGCENALKGYKVTENV